MAMAAIAPSLLNQEKKRSLAKLRAFNWSATIQTISLLHQ
jgi:hypothetical protein